MPKVLITGGAGFIGYNSSIYFLKKGSKLKLLITSQEKLQVLILVN